MTRELRLRSSWAILRVRMASSICWCNVGQRAENTKNIQKRSVKDIMNSCRIRIASAVTLRIEPENTFVGIVRAVTCLGSREQRPKRQSSKKAADMRPPRHTSAHGQPE